MNANAYVYFSDTDNLHNLPDTTKEEAYRHFIILIDPTEEQKLMNVLKTEEMIKKAEDFKATQPKPELNKQVQHIEQINPEEAKQEEEEEEEKSSDSDHQWEDEKPEEPMSKKHESIPDEVEEELLPPEEIKKGSEGIRDIIRNVYIFITFPNH